MLQERFSAFSHDTMQTGSERVADANKLSDDLVSIGHSDADQICQWKDLINEAWQDLTELINTREEVGAVTDARPLVVDRLFTDASRFVRTSQILLRRCRDISSDSRKAPPSARRARPRLHISRGLPTQAQYLRSGHQGDRKSGITRCRCLIVYDATRCDLRR